MIDTDEYPGYGPLSDEELRELARWLSCEARCRGIFDNGPSAADALKRVREEIARREREEVS